MHDFFEKPVAPAAGDTVIDRWYPGDSFPGSGDNVIIQFCNDVGIWFAAGIAFADDSTGNMFFVDVLSGFKYEWAGLVMRWAPIML